jgi:hypothetical protein
LTHLYSNIRSSLISEKDSLFHTQKSWSLKYIASTIPNWASSVLN